MYVYVWIYYAKTLIYSRIVSLLKSCTLFQNKTWVFTLLNDRKVQILMDPKEVETTANLLNNNTIRVLICGFYQKEFTNKSNPRTIII